MQFSGFLDASASTPGARLHYWFAAREGSGDWRDGRGAVAQRRAGVVVDARIFAGERTGARERLGWVDAKSVRVDEDGQSGGDRIACGGGWSCDEMRTGGDCARDDVQTAADATAAVVDFFRKFQS